MNDKYKTKAQLITELQELRRRVAQTESQNGHASVRPLAETVNKTIDTTERAPSEQALHKTQERLQHVLSHGPATLYLLRIEGRRFIAEWISESVTRLTGYEQSEALRGTWWADHLHPDDRERTVARLPVVFADDRLVLEYRFAHKDGGYLWVHDEMRLLRDGSGIPVEVIGSWVDVTERREAEVALRESEERFRTLVGSIEDVVFTLDRDQRYCGLYGGLTEKWGLEREALIGKTPAEVLGAEGARVHEEANDRALSGEPVVYEWRLKNERGTSYFQNSLSAIRDQSGAVMGVAGVARDVTEPKRAADLLRRQTAQLAALHEIGLEISAESELSRILEIVTQRAAALLDASHSNTFIRERDETALRLVASLDGKFIGLRLEGEKGLAGRAVSTGESQGVDDYSKWQGRADVFGADEFGPSIAAPLKWQQTVIGAISIARKQGEKPFIEDDSRLLEQLAAEAAIAIQQATLFDEVHESQRRLQILSHRLIDAQEGERKRLARELHDQIGQALTAVQISLQALQPLPDSVVASKRIEDSLAVIDDALEVVHDLSLDLRPSMLDDLGLVAALRWYVDRVTERAGLVSCFKAEVLGTRLAPEVETACFRIAQEALTNVLRHAYATTVSVQVKHCESGLQLVVKDDGLGFDVRAPMSRTGVNASLGLQGMHERAAALGGVVEIKSTPGDGAEVHVSFPLVHMYFAS